MGRKGRGKRHKNKRNNGGERSANTPADGDGRVRQGRWHVVYNTSRLYREYYAAQGVATDEADFEAMVAKMNDPLPATIRLNAQSPFVDVLRQRLEGDLSEGYPHIATEEDKRKKLVHDVHDKPEPIAWYPGRNAWKFGASKPTIRKHSGLLPLKKFLLQEEQSGNITRQEEASMIPPFFLDVQRHHRVLDMCAAPGSKTSQLLEALHREDAKYNFAPPPGIVVANDTSEQRAYMLVNRLKTAGSANLVVTAHDAQQFPNIDALDGRPEGAVYGAGFFDRILADVPCSGDGTIRKSPEIWKDFDPGNGYALHPLQLLIAQRGIEMLRVGGLLVYSTCSMNPVENEAVVAQLLRANKGTIELVDTSGTVPELKRRPGISSWKLGVALTKEGGPTAEEHVEQVKATATAAAEAAAADPSKPAVTPVLDATPPNRYIRWLPTRAEHKEFIEKENPKGVRVPSTAWPPLAEEVADLHLERCMRIMPHDQNSSGFFVCVLRKTAVTPRLVNVLKAEKDPGSPEKAAMIEAQKAARLAAAIAAEEAAAAKAATATAEAGEDKEEGEKEGEKEGEAVGGKRGAAEDEGALDKRDDSIELLPERLWKPIWEHFGIAIDPDSSLKPDQLFWRSGGGMMMSSSAQKKQRLERQNNVEKNEDPNRVYYVNREISDNILAKNKKQRLKVVSAGVLVLKRNSRRYNSGDLYRVTQTGLKLMLPHITKDKLSMAPEDLAAAWKFMSSKAGLNNPDLEERQRGVPLAILSEPLRKQIAENNLRGSAVFTLNEADQARFAKHFNNEPLAFPFWVGSETVAPLVTLVDLDSVVENARRCGLISDAYLDSIDVEQLRLEHLKSKHTAANTASAESAANADA